MKRKVYRIQVCTPEGEILSATRYAIKSAKAAAAELVKEYATRKGLLGVWNQVKGGAEREGYTTTHAWQVWQAQVAPHCKVRVVINLDPESLT